MDQYWFWKPCQNAKKAEEDQIGVFGQPGNSPELEPHSKDLGINKTRNVQSKYNKIGTIEKLPIAA